MPIPLHEAIRRRFALPLTGMDAATAFKGGAVFRAGRIRWVRECTPDEALAAAHVGSAGGGRVVPADGIAGAVVPFSVAGSTEATRVWELEAAVTGSHGESYLTNVTLSRNAARVHLASDCTCPVAIQCKHAAAAVLAWLEDRDRTPAGEEGGSGAGYENGSRGPGTADQRHTTGSAAAGSVAHRRSRALFQRQHALQWARELNAVRFPAAERAPARLCYVLQVQERSALLSVYRIRKLKNDGSSFSRPDRYPGFVEQALNPPAFWDDVDASVALSMFQQERSPGFSHALNGPRAGDSLLLLVQAGRLFLDVPPQDAGDQPLKQGPTMTARLAWQAPAGSEPDEHGPSLRLGLEVSPSVTPIYCNPPCYLDRATGTLGPLETENPLSPSMMRWLRNAPPVPAGAASEVALTLHASGHSRPALRGRVPPVPQQEVREVTEAPRFVLGLFTTDATQPRQRSRVPRRSFMAISLAVEYAGLRTEPLRLSTMPVQTAEGPRLVVCDQPAERAALTMLREAVSAIAGDEAALTLAPEPRIASGGSGGAGSSGWLTVAALPADGIGAARIKHELAVTLKARGWSVVDHAELPTSLVAADRLVVDLQSGLDPTAEQGTHEWFRLQSGIQVGDRRIDLAPLLAGILASGGFDAWKSTRCPQGVLWMKVSESEVLRLDAARIEPLARVVESWAQLPEDGADETAVLLSPFAAAQLAGVVEGIALPEPVRKLRDWFKTFEGVQPLAAPSSFLATLRPYQRDGLGWLQFLARAGLGGILADDMGLGKTVQVLAHVELERSAGRLAAPVLVVAPTSVIFNWQAEAERHAPALRVLALTGAGRSMRFGDIGEHDLVLTSYALLSRDAAVLRNRQWHAVILDEAQMIKNPRTQGAAAARELAASHRLALTGTPLENHLGELWSIMHFVLPGLLGSDQAFRSRFRAPIERHSGTEIAAGRLRALETRIRPFMLRRTKQAVLADLPPLTKMIQRVELPSEQRDLYESIRAAMDKRVREALARAGLARSQIVLLDALLKLRQACCDPALVKLPGARTVTRSAKRDALIDLLATLVDEGRKALVFSQFTGMLDLIETAIDADPRLAAVARTRLDGDTVDRGAAVARFQQGDAQLFLLSLKAGGVGLNLTAADTVIHYDPWWNPAVESQATDRAHRIGQEKPVFVVKLIAAGTVEERILALQERKAELAAAVLSGALTAAGKALSQEDLLGLFEPL